MLGRNDQTAQRSFTNMLTWPPRLAPDLDGLSTPYAVMMNDRYASGAAARAWQRTNDVNHTRCRFCAT